MLIDYLEEAAREFGGMKENKKSFSQNTNRLWTGQFAMSWLP